MSYYSDILRLGFHEIQKAKAERMMEARIASMPPKLLREAVQLFTDADQALREMDEDCTLRAPAIPVSRLRLIQGEIT